jgi:acetylglutamate kinase
LNKLLEKANVLAEALPYISKLSGKTIVIKYGGNAIQNSEITKTVLEDVAILKIVGINPILVHGGAPEINSALKSLNIESKFHNGLRVTDAQTMEVVQMVLCGKVNKDITNTLNSLGVKAVGISGIDAKIITAEKLNNGFDYGYVGKIVKIDTQLLNLLANDEYIPVIASVGADNFGNSYNINADTVASEIAKSLKAEKLIFLTDVDGIRSNEKDPNSLIASITVSQIYDMIKKGQISGGMIPKVEACIKGIESGIKRTHIINGTIAHPIMLEIFTDTGIGTMVTSD